MSRVFLQFYPSYHTKKNNYDKNVFNLFIFTFTSVYAKNVPVLRQNALKKICKKILRYWNSKRTKITETLKIIFMTLLSTLTSRACAIIVFVVFIINAPYHFHFFRFLRLQNTRTLIRKLLGNWKVIVEFYPKLRSEN